MWGKAAFSRHLKNEMPGWIEKGWVGRDQGVAILAQYDSKDRISMVSAAFGVLGAMLLLSGVITFFAANWSEMSKLVKLVILFAGMLGAYALAIKPFSFESYPRMWATMLLFATGMFGANIMLIAQIYHIDSHYPNGILMWALGALLLAWLVPAQAVMVMALALGALWSSLESIGFDNYNFAFLAFFAVAILRIGQMQWRVAAHAAALSLLLWSLVAYVQYFSDTRGILQLIATELLFIAYLSLFVVGLLMRHFARLGAWSSLVQRYSAFAALGFFYLLTSPRLHAGQWGVWMENMPMRDVAARGDIITVCIAMLVLLGLAGWHHVISRQTERPAFIDWARWLLGACVALLAGTLFLGDESGGVIAMAFNVFYFAALVWLVAAGVHLNDRALVNLAFIFFAITLVTRYFDTFWTLMNRSFFFMAGGVLLLVLGFLLERQRRNFTGRITQQRVTEGGAA